MSESKAAVIKPNDLEFIREATRFLESPSLLVQLTNILGKPVELAQRALPGKLEQKITHATYGALQRGLSWSLKTVKNEDSPKSIEHTHSQSRLHTLGVGVSGAVGGFFGWPGLVVELPFSTLIMLRSILTIAQNSGEDIRDPAIQMECLQIFALGSQKSPSDNEMESAYYIQRLGMTQLVQQASQFITKHTAKEVMLAIEKKSAPAVVKLLTRIASEFEIVVTEKMLAESIPIVGAVGGAAINTAFMNYFNKVATYHFGLKRLENTYGQDVVYEAYLSEIQSLRQKN